MGSDVLKVYHPRLGLVDSDIYTLDGLVREYDPRLHLNRHPDTGDWVVYVELERPNPPYPVFGFGHRLPSKDELLDKLRASDSHKRNIREAMNKHNEALTAEIDYKSRQEIGKAAEMVEAIARKQGMRPDNQSRRKIVKQ